MWKYENRFLKVYWNINLILTINDNFIKAYLITRNSKFFKNFELPDNEEADT
jgi:hypothetical protein